MIVLTLREESSLMVAEVHFSGLSGRADSVLRHLHAGVTVRLTNLRVAVAAGQAPVLQSTPETSHTLLSPSSASRVQTTLSSLTVRRTAVENWEIWAFL